MDAIYFIELTLFMCLSWPNPETIIFAILILYELWEIYKMR